MTDQLNGNQVKFSEDELRHVAQNIIDLSLGVKFHNSIPQILQNQAIVERLNKEIQLWEEPMDSSFSNEIRRSVLRTLKEVRGTPF